MTNFIVYNTASGKILRIGSCPDEMVASQVSSDESVLEGLGNPITQYISNGVVMDKIENPAIIDKNVLSADGEDVATISELDAPSYVTLDGKTYQVTDGSFEFTIDTPGAYAILCRTFPYLDKEFTVNAN